MFPPDDPLYALHADAALASGWPRLRVLASSEAELQRAETHLVAVVGPLPQADHIEPFDAHDPAEPWELRVDLPGLAPARWPTVSAAMGPWEHELTPGAPPEVTTADDTGLRLVEWVDGGGLAARMPVAVDHGAVRLDIRRRPDAVGADDLARIEAQLAEALHRHSPRLRLISDRGHDTVTPVVHRTSGRPGLELCFDPEGFAGTDGDTVLTLRRAAVAALADVVRARADATTLRLAPDPHFELPLGSLSLLAWVVAPHGDPLPGDAPLLDARVPAPRALQALLQAGGQMAHDVEVQVLADADAALELIAASGAPWRGHVPRWVPTADGWRFATTWRAPLSPHRAAQLEGGTLDREGLLAWLAALHGDAVLVEGVGGWCVPLDDAGFAVVDLARAVAAPVLVVAGDRLGVLNHTVLTLRALRADGLTPAAVALNRGVGDPGDPSRATNLHDLRELLDIPVVPVPTLPDLSIPTLADAGEALCDALGGPPAW